MPDTERMRLFAVHVDGEEGIRGGERQLLYLAAALRQAGHGNLIACRAGGALEAEAKRQGFDTLALPFLCEWDPVSAYALKQASEVHGAVVHAHTAHAAGVAALAKRLGGAPWVAHRRVDFALGGTLSRVLKYDAADAVIAVSSAIRTVMAAGGVDPARVEVIPDALPVGAAEAALAGLDAPWGPAADKAALKEELGRRLDLKPGHPWVGNLAAMVPHKDQANLLRAVPLVVKEEPRARFIIVGDGPLRGELKALAESLGVRGAVRFPGRQEDPRPWLQALDLYCQPSWGEGLGSVLLEAMACRIPIVATTAGGIPEVVKDGATARLVAPRDPAALARAILETRGNSEAAEARAAAAARSLERFSLTRMGESVLAVYRRVLKPLYEGARA